MWEVIVICTVFGVFILLSYTLGLKNGQKLSKNEDITMPELNPIKAIQNEIETHEERKKQDQLDIMMSNIDNYDGTGIGQKNIPN